jgi:hypothetical protein
MLKKMSLVGLGVLLISCFVLLAVQASIEFSGNVGVRTKLVIDPPDPIDIRDTFASTDLKVHLEAAWSDDFKATWDTGVDIKGFDHVDFGVKGGLGALYGESLLVFGSPRNRDNEPLGGALFVRWSACTDISIAGVDFEVLFLLEDLNFSRTVFYAIPQTGSYTVADQDIRSGWALTISGISVFGVPFESITNFSFNREASGGYGFLSSNAYPGKVLIDPCLSEVLKLKNICYLGIKLNPEVRLTMPASGEVDLVGATSLAYTIASVEMNTSFDVDLIKLRLKMGRLGMRVVSGPVQFSAYLDQSFEISTTTFGFTIQGDAGTLRTSLGIKPGEGLRSLNINVSRTSGLFAISAAVTMSKETPESQWLDFSRAALNVRWMTSRHTVELTSVMRGYPTTYMEWGLGYTYKF